MAITYEHAKRLVLTSAAIMEADPARHGYNGGAMVDPIAVVGEGRSRRVCFCLMGGASVLLLTERGQTYKARAPYPGRAYGEAWSDLYAALRGMWIDLIDAHDHTEDASEMAAKVRAIFAEHDET